MKLGTALTAAPAPRASGAPKKRPPGLVEQGEVASDLHISCDVVIVGSGAGGATMAAELADAGLDVVVIEEGGYHPTESFTPNAGQAIRQLYRAAGAQTTIGSPPIIFSEGRCVGGSTVINGGMSWRTPDHILDRWSREEGIAGISPREMERYFEKVERRISVGYQDPESIGRDAELLKLGADRQGWKIIPNLRNQLHCAGTNNCAFGCPTGAKRSMLVTYVPRALSRGARLYADCKVDKITRVGKRATGVVGHFLRPDGRKGPRLTVRASLTISACGSMQTPALLARSGFASPSGQLGKNLTLHPNAKLVAIFDEQVKGWHGVHQAFQVREFMDDNILMTAVNVPPSILTMGFPHHGAELGELMQDYNRMVVAGILVEDSTTGTVKTLPGGAPLAFYEITEKDVERLIRGMALTAELMFAAGAKRIILPFEGVPDLMGPDDVRSLFRRKIARNSIELVTVHIMGTARMSDDRTHGVTSSYGEVHDAAGLFVADASLFPSPVGVNPMETIMGVVTRNAEHIINNRQRYFA
jgi:choline dehydrogenase-like flavoprotein